MKHKIDVQRLARVGAVLDSSSNSLRQHMVRKRSERERQQELQLTYNRLQDDWPCHRARPFGGFHNGRSGNLHRAPHHRHQLERIGSSAGPTIIDGGGAATVVTIPNTSTSVILSRMTIRNGDAQAGAGIYNSGNLVITSTTISGNRTCCLGGGGIYNVGTLTIYDSTVSGNFATGPCAINLPRGIFKCFGGIGGGIRSFGPLTINNSTVSGNTARCGPFCVAPSAGGGVAIDAGTLAISNSTISGNHAGIGGGIRGAATLQNSIVAYNYGNCSGTMTSNGYNLSSDSTCNFNNRGDWNSTDPLLGPLQYNRGPTQTMALQPGSPAIDAGNPSGCTDGAGHLLKTDQRGLPRPNTEDIKDQKGCDMGAYETQSD